MSQCRSTAPRAPVPPEKPASKPTDTCGLILRIRGDRYSVKPVSCDPSLVSRCFRLRKLGGDRVQYHVALTPRGHICECADYVWKRDGRDPAGCKHIRSLVAVGLLDRFAPGLAGPKKTRSADLISPATAESIARTSLVGHQP